MRARLAIVATSSMTVSYLFLPERGRGSLLRRVDAGPPPFSVNADADRLSYAANGRWARGGSGGVEHRGDQLAVNPGNGARSDAGDLKHRLRERRSFGNVGVKRSQCMGSVEILQRKGANQDVYGHSCCCVHVVGSFTRDPRQVYVETSLF